MASQSIQINDIEAALVSGDLSRLGPEGRIEFYKQVCDSLGLNPLTQPFDYIVLNGKLKLYAKKDCTEQLRRIHSVSVIRLEKERIEDVYTVTAYVRDKTGREDSSIGAVTIGGAKGDGLANMLMKAETKAKRRATLSICGLGILDESEIETIPDAKHFKEAEPEVPKVSPVPPVNPLINQLEASLAITPAIEKIKVADEYKFSVVGDRVTCRPVEIVKKRKRESGSEYVFIKMDDEVESLASAFCYDTKLFEALKGCKDSVLVFTGVTRKGFLHIEDVHRVGKQEYVDGLPVGTQREPQSIDSEPF